MKHLLQQCLETLGIVIDLVNKIGHEDARANKIIEYTQHKIILEKIENVHASLKEALAKDEMAPVACMHEPFEGRCIHCQVKFVDGIPSYTHPAQRQPLSDEEIEDIWAVSSDPDSDEMSITKFAHTIENAVYEKMGIK